MTAGESIWFLIGISIGGIIGLTVKVMITYTSDYIKKEESECERMFRDGVKAGLREQELRDEYGENISFLDKWRYK